MNDRDDQILFMTSYKTVTTIWKNPLTVVFILTGRREEGRDFIPALINSKWQFSF